MANEQCQSYANLGCGDFKAINSLPSAL